MGVSRNRVAMIVLLGCLVGSLAYLTANGPSKPAFGTLRDASVKLQDNTQTWGHSERGISERAAMPSKPADKVIVYYFHSTRRGFSCRLMESLAEEVVKTEFGADLKQARLEFHSVNTDKSQNRHFISDYGLHTQSIVLSEFRGGREVRHKILVRIWALLHQKAGLQRHIQGEVRAYLKAR